MEFMALERRPNILTTTVYSKGDFSRPSLRLCQHINWFGGLFQGIKKTGREGNDLLRIAEQGLHIFCRYDDDIRRASVYVIDNLHILAERMLSVHELFNDMSSFDDSSATLLANTITNGYR